MQGQSKPFISTSSGIRFEFPPKPEQVRLSDISWALSNICRYGGHSLRHYSVAEHIVRGYWLSVKLGNTLNNTLKDFLSVMPHWILHDSAEAYTGDICKPIKTEADEFREEQVLDVIYQAVGIDKPDTAVQEKVKELDNLIFFVETQVMCVTEISAYHHERYLTWVSEEVKWLKPTLNTKTLDALVELAFPRRPFEKSYKEEYESIWKRHLRVV